LLNLIIPTKYANVKACALEYIKAGLCAIPTVQGEKRPIVAWKQYQSRYPTEIEWTDWEHSNTLGIVCGAISDNLLVFDFDQCGKVFEDFKNNIPSDLWQRFIIEQSPSGGYHIFVRSEQSIDGNEVLAWEPDGKTRLIEPRAEGGFIVCAPSPGYKMLQSTFDNIPILQSNEIKLLIDAARSFDLAPKPNYSFPKSSVMPTFLPVNVPEVECRAIAYIAKMPEAISGQGGHNITLSVVNKLYEFGLDRTTAKQIFIEHYNPRCIPPWSEKEIDHKFDRHTRNRSMKRDVCWQNQTRQYL